MKHKKGDVVKIYIIEKTNQYGTVYHNPINPNGWTVDVHCAILYRDLQVCKNTASYLLGKSIERNQKYPDVFPIIDDITVRKLEIKFVD